MKNIFISSACLFLLLILSACSEKESATNDANIKNNTAISDSDAWIQLFDGTDLDHWNTTGDANWIVEDDTVSANSGSGMLVSKIPYADFHLTLDFWVDRPANSGVFIRCLEASNITASNCYEVNIFDTRPDQTYRTGGIVDIAPPISIVNAADHWNRYEIIAKGSRLTVKLNDILTVDTEDTKFSEGVIALQYGAGVVKFRNIAINNTL